MLFVLILSLFDGPFWIPNLTMDECLRRSSFDVKNENCGKRALEIGVGGSDHYLMYSVLEGYFIDL